MTNFLHTTYTAYVDDQNTEEDNRYEAEDTTVTYTTACAALKEMMNKFGNDKRLNRYIRIEVIDEPIDKPESWTE